MKTADNIPDGSELAREQRHVREDGTCPHTVPLRILRSAQSSGSGKPVVLSHLITDNILDTAVQFDVRRLLAQSSAASHCWSFAATRKPSWRLRTLRQCSESSRTDQSCSDSKNPFFWQKMALMLMSPILCALSSTMEIHGMVSWTSTEAGDCLSNRPVLPDACPAQDDMLAAGDDARSALPPQNVDHPSDSPQSSEDRGLRLILGERNPRSHANHLPQHPGNHSAAFLNMSNHRPRWMI